MNYNKIVIGGRLTADPELKTTQNGKTITPFTVAINRPGKDAGAVFLDCTAFDKTAETVANYFRKGNQILVEGRMDSRTVEKDGQKRIYWNVIAERIEFVDPRDAAPKPESDAANFRDIGGGDLPF